MDKKGFYDAELERMMFGDDSTYQYQKQEKKHNDPPREEKASPRRPVSFDDFEPRGAENRGSSGRKAERWKPAIHGENEVEGFDGWFFRDRDQSGRPVIRLVAERMSASEAIRADEWYGMLGRLSGGCFLHRSASSPVEVDGHMVFDFEIGNNVYSLGEQHRQKKLNLRNPETILSKLNYLIMKYQKELQRSGEPYRALNCLTMDTVFVDADNNLMVLPVYYHGRNYPVEIAREAMIQGQKTDERSDLYAAAYVAVEAFSDSNGDRPLGKPNSEVILACLQTIREWRPMPQEVEQWFSGKRPGPRTRVGGTPNDVQIPRPDTGKWMKKVSEWVSSVKGFEEREDDDDNEVTNKRSRGFTAGEADDDSDDSWYDYGRK